MNEIDYSAVFELEEGVKEQAVAEPAQSEDAQGEKEAEAAAPPVEDDTETEDQPAETGSEEKPTEENPMPADETQSPEERAKYAAARRKAEAQRDAEIARIKEDAQKTIDEAFAASGLTNPYTKKPITSKAEYDEYRQRFEQEKRERILKKTGMSDDEFKQYVDTLPEVQQAKAAQAEAEAAQRQAQEQQAEQRVNEQLKEIGTLDPSIKTLADLGKMPNYPEFYERVKRGMTLTEAFKLTNYDALTRGASAAGRQAALNAAHGKGHLTPTAQRGSGKGSVPVPADVKELYRELNPGITDAEIQAHYNAARKA